MTTFELKSFLMFRLGVKDDVNAKIKSGFKRFI